MNGVPVPPAGAEIHPWRQEFRRGTIVAEVTVSVPAKLTGLLVRLPPELASLSMMQCALSMG